MSASAFPTISDAHATGAESQLRLLDPNKLAGHLEALYDVARRLCGSHEDAEDLVQETLAGLLQRPRLLRGDDDRRYLIRALRNTQVTKHRAATRRPRTVPLLQNHCEVQALPTSPFDARELMRAISAASKPYRDAVLAVDVVGLSYRQAAHQLGIREATITTRLHRGRRQVLEAFKERFNESSSD